MTSHILTPLKAMAARIRSTTPPSPGVPSFEGMEVPPHLVGKPFGIFDSEGNLVGTVGLKRMDAKIAGMIG